MIDIQELKTLAADAAGKEPGSPAQFLALQNMSKLANPAAVLGLISERTVALFQLDIQREIVARRYEEIEKLKAENESLRQQLAIPSDVLADAEALRRDNEALRIKLLEASEEIFTWGAYASEYYQEKHDLAGCVAKFHDAAMSKEASHD